MSPRKAGREDVAAAKRAVKDAKAAAKAADKEAKAAAKRARKNKRAAARPGHQGGRYVPIEKRLKNQQRERAAVEAAAERARRAARDVYRLIGFDALYADGIAQVEPGLFSQTVSFGDISYQSMGDESQKSVCRQMRKLYDGLTPDVGLQLLLLNRPLTKGEMSNRRFFGRVEGPAAPYAAEYSRILNDKMAEGVSNIMRERYLTFSVSADTAEESVPKLARLRSMADGVLSGMRSGTRVLRGEERLQLIRSMTRPGRERAEFGYDDLGVTRGITAKDLACPDTMEFKPGGSASCFTSDGVWCQVLAFRSFESNLTDRCLADMVDLPMPLAISFHVRAMNPRWSKDYVRRRLKWIDKEMSEDQMDAVSKGYDFNLIPSELKFTREEAQDVYECLKGDSQRLFRYTGLVFTYAPTREELDEQAMHLISVAQAQGIELANLDYRQREGLNSVLPLGRNHVRVGRLMLTDEIAIQSPFATLELNDFGGGYYGQNKGSRNLVMLNRKGLASRNGIISGMPGSGKSFGAKREMTNTALLYPEDDVVIIDPAGEFGLLAEAFGGRNVAFGPDSETYLNPLDLSDVSELLETTQLAYKIEAVLALSAASMAEGNEGLSDVERSIISRCVEKAYLTCGRSGAVPQLQDLYDILRQQPEPEAEVVALRFERYVSGALSIFNHQSNVAFDRRITCVGLKDLPDNMRAFGIIAVLEAVRNRMYANFERGVTTWLYIDEVQSLFGHPATISYFSRFWAEGRKFNLICTGITQNCTYLLSHKDGRNLILNSDFLMLHRQSFADKAKWSELLNLSEQEEGYIDESVNPGDGLLIAGGSRVPIVDDFPKGALYDLFNTKPDEIPSASAPPTSPSARQSLRPAPTRPRRRAMSGRGADARRQGFASAESVEAGNARFESRGGGTFKGPDQGSFAEGGKGGVYGAADGAPDAAVAKGGFAGRAGSAIAAGFVGELDDSDELSGSEGAYRAGRAAADIRKRRRARLESDPFAPVEDTANADAVAAKEAKRAAGEARAVAGPGGSAESAPRSKSLLARAREGLGGKAARRSAATGGKAAGGSSLGEARAEIGRAHV